LPLGQPQKGPVPASFKSDTLNVHSIIKNPQIPFKHPQMVKSTHGKIREKTEKTEESLTLICTK